MLNREIYLRDPSTIKLANDGVANVNDERTDQALRVLRYELETFVCDGQYEKGLNHILEIYLQNINQAQQPSVWISGFYGWANRTWPKCFGLYGWIQFFPMALQPEA
jgi:hypothetical protein